MRLECYAASKTDVAIQQISCALSSTSRLDRVQVLFSNLENTDSTDKGRQLPMSLFQQDIICERNKYSSYANKMCALRNIKEQPERQRRIDSWVPLPRIYFSARHCSLPFIKKMRKDQ